MRVGVPIVLVWKLKLPEVLARATDGSHDFVSGVQSGLVGAKGVAKLTWQFC
jgi:hypothetical protein